MHEEADPTGFNADFNMLKLSGSKTLQELKVSTTHLKVSLCDANTKLDSHGELWAADNAEPGML